MFLFFKLSDFIFLFPGIDMGNGIVRYKAEVDVGKPLFIQCKPLNEITLGQAETDNINQMKR